MRKRVAESEPNSDAKIEQENSGSDKSPVANIGVCYKGRNGRGQHERKKKKLKADRKHKRDEELKFILRFQSEI